MRVAAPESTSSQVARIWFAQKSIAVIMVTLLIYLSIETERLSLYTR